MTRPTYLFILLSACSLISLGQDHDSTKDKSDSTLVASANDDTVTIALNSKQSLFSAPVSVELLTAKKLKNEPSADLFHAIGKMRGVYQVHSGMLSSSLNGLGFAKTNSSGIMILSDGMDNQLPDMNHTLGNFSGVTELDLEQAEIIPFTSSALYGPYAMNGVVKLNSKSPFEREELSVMVRSGINSVHTLAGSESEPFNQVSTRYGKKFSAKVAAELNLNWINSDDWQPSYPGNIRIGSNNQGTQNNDPGFDGVNYGGDEFNTIIPFGPGGSDVDIARTGYHEQEILSYSTSLMQANGSFFYRFFPNVEGSVYFGFSRSNSNGTGINRVSLPDLDQKQLKVNLEGKQFQIQYYSTQHLFGQSIDSKLLSRNLNIFAKNNTAWILDFSAAFGGALVDIGIPAGDVEAARQFADGPGNDFFGVFSPRPDPEDPNFNSIVNQLIDGPFSNNNPVISEYQGKQRLRHLEARFDFADLIPFFDISAGFSHRWNFLNENNTSYNTLNSGLTNLDYQILSFSGQISKKLFNDRLQLVYNLRFDDHNMFRSSTSKRMAVSVSPFKNHNFRFSYNTGFRWPSIQELFLFRDGGPGRIRGGFILLNSLVFQNNGLNLFPLAGNTVFLKNVESFDLQLRDRVADGTPKAQAIQELLPLITSGILTNNAFAPLEKEKRKFYEVGYRARLFNRLSVDLSGTYSITENLIGLVGVVRPFGLISPLSVDPAGAANALRDDRRRQLVYFQQNSKNNVASYTASLGLSLDLDRNFFINGNTTWTEHDQKPGLVEGAFNTTPLSIYAGIGNTRIFNKFSFYFDMQFQEDFIWHSSLGTGTVPAFTSFDAQITYHWDELGASVRIAAQNLLNENYYNNFGGPSIGSVYLISIMMENLLPPKRL